MDSRSAKTLANTLHALGRGARALMPERVKRALEDRFFYAVFQMTRVQNDDAVNPQVRARRAKDSQQR